MPVCRLGGPATLGKDAPSPWRPRSGQTRARPRGSRPEPGGTGPARSATSFERRFSPGGELFGRLVAAAPQRAGGSYLWGPPRPLAQRAGVATRGAPALAWSPGPVG